VGFQLGKPGLSSLNLGPGSPDLGKTEESLLINNGGGTGSWSCSLFLGASEGTDAGRMSMSLGHPSLGESRSMGIYLSSCSCGGAKSKAGAGRGSCCYGCGCGRSGLASLIERYAAASIGGKEATVQFHRSLMLLSAEGNGFLHYRFVSGPRSCTAGRTGIERHHVHIHAAHVAKSHHTSREAHATTSGHAHDSAASAGRHGSSTEHEVPGE
jgi:hypothetical protein